MLTVRGAASAALTLAFAFATPALADPGDRDDTSATVELLRVAAEDGDRFTDIRIAQDGRILGLPQGGPEILINNPAVCADLTRLL